MSVQEERGPNYPVLSFPILSYPILPIAILSYPILSYPILSHRKQSFRCWGLCIKMGTIYQNVHGYQSGCGCDIPLLEFIPPGLKHQ